MSRPLRPGRTVLASLVLLAALIVAGCAPAVDGPPGADQTTSGQATEDGGTDEEDGGTADGEEDPEQDRVRTGPVAQYGGPAYGDQGEAEIVQPGVWCKTIAVFWGGDEPIPEGVRFTFDGAVVDGPGLAVSAAVCGTLGADRPCLGMTVESDASGIFCSIEVRPGEGFEDGREITFEGTLECPTAAVCDAVAARVVEPGPPLVVNTPAGA